MCRRKVLQNGYSGGGLRHYWAGVASVERFQINSSSFPGFRLALGACAVENAGWEDFGFREDCGVIRWGFFIEDGLMPTTFRRYEPDQMLLLAPDLREWVGEGHLAHHVSDLVDSVDLSGFYAPYEGDGRRNAPYEPLMMVKVLIYAYATGVFSSRRIARKLARR